MSKSRMQTSVSSEERAPVLEENESVTSTGGDRGNQAAAQQLAPAAEEESPSVTLGDVGDANSFMSAASRAMDAALPTVGSFAKISVAGNIPLVTYGVADITFSPSLDLQVARERTGGYSAMIAAKVQLKAKAGQEGWGWFPDFEAYVSGYLKGSLKIQGDSATEIMRLFMLAVRHTMEAACDAAGAPEGIKENIAGAIMGEDTKQETLHGMDKYDRVIASVGLGAEAGASAGAFSGSVGADLSHTTMLTNKDGDMDNAEVNSFGRASFTVSGSMSLPSLPIKISPKISFIMGTDGKPVEWFVAMGATGTMTAGEFAPIALMGADWATEFSIAMGNMIRNAANKGARSESGMITDIVNGLSFGPEAVTYTVFGDQLKKWAVSPAFAGESQQKIEFGINAQAGWSKFFGANCSGALSSVRSFKLGGGDGPLSIEASKGDNIAQFRKTSS
ncbi:MAG: hypothetical protein CL927_05685 [Deltaproteobacteria bacterium]|nr:hypothetical protein [Deltaproteobacteria bacterium]HCH62936.1 hypothetical protein [Deltaproteobacteria bacterium]